MNVSEFNKAIKSVEAMIQGLHEGGRGTPPLNPHSLVTFAKPELGGVSLWGQGLESYRECISLLTATINPKKSIESFSERAVEAALQDAMLKALDVAERRSDVTFDERLSDSLKELKALLSAQPATWDVYLQVEGLDLGYTCLTFGRAKFFIADEVVVRNLRRKIVSFVFSASQPFHEKKEWARLFRQQIYDHLSGRPFGPAVLAKLTVPAVDETAAQAAAERELSLTLDVLNFYTTVVHPRGTKIRVYAPGETARTSVLAFCFQENQKPQRARLNVTVRGPLAGFSVARLSLLDATHMGFAQASTILAKPTHSEFEERILAALRFAGRANVNDEREESFLGFAIALESLLGDKEGGEITFKLAVRCAHLLGATSDERKSIFDSVKKLYGVRSKIVHRGSTEVTDADLGQMRNIVLNAIVVALTSPDFAEIKRADEFLKWFDSKVLN
jgi:hypothetical protein